MSSTSGGTRKTTLKTFFFSTSTGRSEALFRIGYSIVLLVDLLCQAGKWELLYSNRGLPVGTLIDWLYAPSVVNTLYFAWITVLLLLAIGALTRWTSILNYALLCYFFMLRGVFVGHGADWVFHSMGFYLMFMTSDRCFSLWNRWFPGQRQQHWGDTESTWPLRLAQINFVFIYFSAGVAKLFDPVWLDGSALELTLSHPFLVYPTAVYLGSSSLFLAFLTYITTLWQLAFPLALFGRLLRVFFVVSALAFHVLITLTMRVGWFSEIMIASALLFWDDFAFYFGSGRENEGQHEKTLPETVSTAATVRTFTRFFITAYLVLFAVTQIYFISKLAGSPLTLLERPAEFAAKITGNRPYDLVPSKYLRSVRFVVSEIVDREGRTGLLYPFTASGELDFGLSDLKEIRLGLARVRLASGRASPVIWTNFINQVMLPEVHSGDWQYPVEINIYRINVPIGQVARPFNVREVPRQLVSRVVLPTRDSKVQLPSNSAQPPVDLR